MANAPFVFKQFTVNQNKSAMKIGTDSVLLGAWATIKNQPFSILDIGSGTGILSLLLAQRCFAEVIDALEIDDAAYEECVENFEQSPWSDRLFCYHASLEEFADEIEEEYDLIVCNPPFYTDDFKSNNQSRDLARFQDAMPFQHLLQSVAILLSENGIFSVIIPKKEEAHFIELASHYQLSPVRICHVKGHPTSKIKRSLIEFSFTEFEIKNETLTIETERHVYTPEYIALTKDFYLKM